MAITIPDNAIVANLTLSSTRLLTDGGLRWTFDAQENAILQEAHLKTARLQGAYFECYFVPKFLGGGDDEEAGSNNEQRKVIGRKPQGNQDEV